MTKRLSPAFVELTIDALLKVTWYKPTFRRFLQQNGIPANLLAQWHGDQTKRDFAEWLFPQIVDTDDGQNIILMMARNLSDMRHFPDLERHEDSKQKIVDAKSAVSRLKDEVDKIGEAIRDEREIEQRRKEAQKRQAASIATQQSIEKLHGSLNGLMPQIGTQDGGYAFERWFYELAIFFELDARLPYKVGDRQIDGAVTIDGTTYLVEAKFTSSAVGSPEIDIFMSKIESKADNTMGLFVSMSGFNDSAKREASKRRTPMLLLDYTHIYNLILSGVMTFPQVVSRIKRHASQTGVAHLAAADF